MPADGTSCEVDNTGSLQLDLGSGANTGRKEDQPVETDSSLRGHTGILGLPDRYNEESEEDDTATGER
jgi:hypothetical protein